VVVEGHGCRRGKEEHRDLQDWSLVGTETKHAVRGVHCFSPACLSLINLCHE
jgi:hypothetical protein